MFAAYPDSLNINLPFCGCAGSSPNATTCQKGRVPNGRLCCQIRRSVSPVQWPERLRIETGKSFSSTLSYPLTHSDTLLDHRFL